MNVMVAIDSSRVTDSVIGKTTQIFGGGQARVLLINVAPREPDVIGQQVRRKVISDSVPEELRDRRELLDRHAAILTNVGIDCETLLIRGDPGPTLLREAMRWDADLIIMGSHGRGALYRKLVGSVSEAVLKSRRFPLLIVPARRKES